MIFPLATNAGDPIPPQVAIAHRKGRSATRSMRVGTAKPLEVDPQRRHRLDERGRVLAACLVAGGPDPAGGVWLGRPWRIGSRGQVPLLRRCPLARFCLLWPRLNLFLASRLSTASVSTLAFPACRQARLQVDPVLAPTLSRRRPAARRCVGSGRCRTASWKSTALKATPTRPRHTAHV